jgi:hypothetical protein
MSRPEGNALDHVQEAVSETSSLESENSEASSDAVGFVAGGAAPQQTTRPSRPLTSVLPKPKSRAYMAALWVAHCCAIPWSLLCLWILLFFADLLGS